MIRNTGFTERLF